MNLHLHIERLILEGLPLEASGEPALRAAVEAELAQRFSAAGLGSGLGRGGAFAATPIGHIDLPPASEPAELGRRIGGAVHGSLAP